MDNREKIFLDHIEAHKGIIYKISRMYMEQEEDQQDLFQEIVYQLWKSYDSFSRQSKFSTWMYRVAVNTAISFFKKEKKKMDQSGRMPEQVPTEEDTKELQLSHFYKALQQLEKIEKALIFFHLENYSHKEISVNLGISEGNVRVKLNRAKNKLKEIIKKQGYEF